MAVGGWAGRVAREGEGGSSAPAAAAGGGGAASRATGGVSPGPAEGRRGDAWAPVPRVWNAAADAAACDQTRLALTRKHSNRELCSNFAKTRKHTKLQKKTQNAKPARRIFSTLGPLPQRQAGWHSKPRGWANGRTKQAVRPTFALHIVHRALYGCRTLTSRRPPWPVSQGASIHLAVATNEGTASWVLNARLSEARMQSVPPRLPRTGREGPDEGASRAGRTSSLGKSSGGVCRQQL